MSYEKNWITEFKVKVTAKVQKVGEWSSGWHLLIRKIFCYQTWYSDAASWVGVSCREEMYTVFKVKVTARAHTIKIWLSAISSELLILWQPNLVWWYIITSPSILWKKMDYCVQSQSHDKGSKCEWRFVQISSEPLNLLLPNLVWWCIILSQSVVFFCLFFVFYKIGLLSSRSRSQWRII